MKRGFTLYFLLLTGLTFAQSPIKKIYPQRLSPYQLVAKNDSQIFMAGYNTLAPQISLLDDNGKTEYFADLWGGSYGASLAFNVDLEGNAMFAGQIISIDTLVFNGDTFYAPIKSLKQYINHLDGNGTLDHGVIFPQLFDHIRYVEQIPDGYITAAVGDLLESIHIVHINSSGKILKRHIGPTSLNAGKKIIKRSNDSTLISFGYDEAWTINKWTGTYKTWDLKVLRAKYPILYLTAVLRSRDDRIYVVSSHRVHNDSVSNTLLAEISPDGSIVRDSLFSDPLNDTWIVDFQYDQDSNLLLGGYRRTGKDTITANALIWKMDRSWNTLWKSEFTGDGMNCITRIQAFNDTQYIACGYHDYYSFENMLSPQANKQSGSFFMVVDSSGNDVTSDGLLEKKSESLFLYPNPASSYVELNLDPDLVELFNLNGSRVFQTNQRGFDISHLDNGIYFVRIESDGDMSYSKLVKIQ